ANLPRFPPSGVFFPPPRAHTVPPWRATSGSAVPAGAHSGPFNEGLDEGHLVGAAGVRGAVSGNPERVPPAVARTSRAHRIRAVGDLCEPRGASGLSPASSRAPRRTMNRPKSPGGPKPTRRNAMRTVKTTSLGSTIWLAIALALAPWDVAHAWTDPCAPYVSEIATLQHKLAVDQQQLAGLEDSPNPRLQGKKEAQLELAIAQYQREIGIAQTAYAQCEADNPPPSPPPSVRPFDGVLSGVDPQLAVGKRYIVEIDSGKIAFYKRNPDGSVG